MAHGIAPRDVRPHPFASRKISIDRDFAKSQNSAALKRFKSLPESLFISVFLIVGPLPLVLWRQSRHTARERLQERWVSCSGPQGVKGRERAVPFHRILVKAEWELRPRRFTFPCRCRHCAHSKRALRCMAEIPEHSLVKHEELNA